MTWTQDSAATWRMESGLCSHLFSFFSPVLSLLCVTLGRRELERDPCLLLLWLLLWFSAGGSCSSGWRPPKTGALVSRSVGLWGLLPERSLMVPPLQAPQLPLLVSSYLWDFAHGAQKTHSCLLSPNSIQANTYSCFSKWKEYRFLSCHTSCYGIISF